MVTYTVSIPKAKGSTHAGTSAGPDLYAYDRENQTKRWFKSGKWNDGREVKLATIKVKRAKIEKYDHKAYCTRMFERIKRSRPKQGETNAQRNQDPQ